ncbi:hypothetical protein D3C72_2197760 [compost metagenome]
MLDSTREIGAISSHFSRCFQLCTVGAFCFNISAICFTEKPCQYSNAACRRGSLSSEVSVWICMICPHVDDEGKATQATAAAR